jgi:putative endonuclease
VRGASDRGRTNDAAGRAAEEQVEAFYATKGARLAARRWRGKAGEIDLIFREGAVTVFVEVKKSRDHDRAAAALSPRQQARIMAAAEEYLADSEAGALAEMRFDVALLDAHGRLKIIEAALGG